MMGVVVRRGAVSVFVHSQARAHAERKRLAHRVVWSSTRSWVRSGAIIPYQVVICGVPFRS
jgi:hypothetical protein